MWKEVVTDGKGRIGAAEIEVACQAGWIEVVQVTNNPITELLKRDLDEGEAEVIALALEHKSDLILLDEAEARRIAGRYDLAKTGVVGVLIRAKREEKIVSLREELNNLRNQGNFWMSERLRDQALHVVGEM